MVCSLQKTFDSMSPARSSFARLLSFPEQSWRQTMQYTKRTATFFPDQDAAGHGRVVSTQNQGKNYRPANRLANPNPRFSEGPNFRNPEDLHSHEGNSSFGYGGNMAGDANRKASLDSANLVQGGNVHDMSTSSDAQEKLLRYGANAGVVSRDSMAPPFDRGPSRPDATGPFQQRLEGRPYAAGFVNQRPQGELPRDVTSFQKGDIPQQHDITSHTEEYNVRKARVHASLWQQEIRKQAGEATSVEGNPDAELSDSFSNARVGKVGLEDWETFDPSEGQFYDVSRGKEEAMMFEEFDRRRERNRILIASFVKQHLYGRRRPVDGWKYILNNFGLESKGEKGSALGGRQTTGNELEKLALKRESGRLRRKD